MLIFPSCGKNVYVPVESRTDSVVIRDLIAYPILPDTSGIDALILCDERGNAYLSEIDILYGKLSDMTVSLDSLGRLKVRNFTPPDTIYLPSEKTTVTKTVNTPIEVPVQLSGFEKITLKSGYLLYGVVIALVAWIIFKKIRK